MSDIPFVLSLDTPAYFGHDILPNRIYRQLHSRHHDPLDVHTLGLMARLGAHAHRLHAQKTGELGGIYVKDENSAFEVHLDVGLFTPEELSVKVVNNQIVVEGKHEEREDEHGSIARHFLRRYDLPKNCNLDTIESSVSSDGVLTVRIPKPTVEEKANERVIEIKRVGASDLFLKNNKKKSVDDPTDDELKAN